MRIRWPSSVYEVCCPDDIPTDCSDDSWSWSSESAWYGCCSQDLSTAVGCYGGYYADACGYGYECAYFSDYGGYVDCNW